MLKLRLDLLQPFSDEELAAEIERRKTIAEAPAMPVLVANPDFTGLIDTIVTGHRYTAERGYEDDDFEHWVYEAAMVAVYGKEYWDWRKRQKWAQ